MRTCTSSDISRKNLLTEGKVQGLSREITNDVGCVAAPEGEKPLVTVSASKAIPDTVIFVAKTALLDLQQAISGSAS